MWKVRHVLGALADLVLPPACHGCQRPLADPNVIWCEQCAATLLQITVPDYCPRCGGSVGPHLISPSGCRACRGQATPLAGVVRAGRYDGFLREMIRRYKYGGQQRLDKTLGRMLAEAIQGRPWADELDGLVPVPAPWRSRMDYGFSPVDLVAREVGRRLGVPVLTLMHVEGKKKRQVELAASQRTANVRGVFRLRRQARPNGAILCVIDDVATTGATIREMGRVLKRAGAKRVYAATVARQDRDPVVVTSDSTHQEQKTAN